MASLIVYVLSHIGFLLDAEYSTIIKLNNESSCSGAIWRTKSSMGLSLG